jgi:hypothetical protein
VAQLLVVAADKIAQLRQLSSGEGSVEARNALIKERVMASKLIPVGSEVQVNQDQSPPNQYGVAFNQTIPDIVPVSSGGRFAVAYTTQYVFNPSGDWDIFGQYLNDNGTRSGGALAVSNPTGFQDNPQAAPRTDGGFATVFEDYGTGGTFTHSDVRAAITSAGGVSSSISIPIATFSTFSTSNPDIALLQDGSGRQLVTYQYTHSSTEHDIYWNILNANGTTLFPATTDSSAQVVVGDIFDQRFPVVAATGNTALVVYQDTSSGNQQFIAARLFNDATSAFGSSTTVAFHPGDLTQPDVAGLAGDRYVIAYGDGSQIYARIYDPVTPGGAFLTPEVPVNAVAGSVSGPRVFATVDGGFITSWEQFDGSDYNIHARRFDAHGLAFGDDFVVNTSTSNFQLFSAGAVNGSNVVITWEDFGPRPTDTSGTGIRAQAFTAPVFDYDSAQYGDFNNNGRADILFQNDNPASDAAIWQTSASGALSTVSSLGPVPAGFRIDGTGNFNGTAGDDILLRSPNSVAVWVMNGTTPQSVQTLGGTTPLWVNSGIGDFTGDNQDDLLFRNVNTGEIATWGVANNALSTTPKVLGSTAPQYHIVAVDDFTGDGQADILFRHDNGDIAIWRVANNSLAGTPAVVGSTSTAYHVVGTGDFDANGANDILFRNDNGDLAMWLLNSAGQLLGAPQAIGNAAAQFHVDGTGDFNGDGRADIMFRDANGTLVEWFMNGAAFAAPPSALGTAAVDYAIAAHHYDLV